MLTLFEIMHTKHMSPSVCLILPTSIIHRFLDTSIALEFFRLQARMSSRKQVVGERENGVEKMLVYTRNCSFTSTFRWWRVLNCLLAWPHMDT